MRPMPELRVEEMPIERLEPYARNAKLHTEEQVEQIAASIEEFGFNDPVGVWDAPGGGLEIVEGHGRVLAARKLGLGVVPVVRLDHMDDGQRRAYALVHNKLTMNTGWDFAKLDEELSALDGFDMESFGFEGMTAEDVPELSDKYSQNVGKVEYEPRDTSWKASELYDFDPERKERLEGLIAEVKNAQLKKMLKIRLDWFCEFDFAKIADYYANQATAEEQRAFEGLGLVLLDRDQLIANGFADIVEGISE